MQTTFHAIGSHDINAAALGSLLERLIEKFEQIKQLEHKEQQNKTVNDSIETLQPGQCPIEFVFESKTLPRIRVSDYIRRYRDTFFLNFSAPIFMISKNPTPFLNKKLNDIVSRAYTHMLTRFFSSIQNTTSQSVTGIQFLGCRSDHRDDLHRSTAHETPTYPSNALQCSSIGVCEVR
jgi:hypothetical protein